jgi:hypothetical protein
MRHFKLILLQESLEELQMSRDKLSSDHDRLKRDKLEKEEQLISLKALSDKREQAKQEMKGFTANTKC